MQKNIQRISRLPWERPHRELQNEAPLDSLELPLPNPFKASLLQTWSRGWPLRDIDAQTYQVGTRFEALDEGVLMAPMDPRYTQVGFIFISFQVWGSLWTSQQGPSHGSLEILWIFFSHFNFPWTMVCNSQTLLWPHCGPLSLVKLCLIYVMILMAKRG